MRIDLWMSRIFSIIVVLLGVAGLLLMTKAMITMQTSPNVVVDVSAEPIILSNMIASLTIQATVYTAMIIYGTACCFLGRTIKIRFLD